MSDNSFAVGMAVGCGQAGGVLLGGTIVGILNHGFSSAAWILLFLGSLLFIASFNAGRVAVGGRA